MASVINITIMGFECDWNPGECLTRNSTSSQTLTGVNKVCILKKKVLPKDNYFPW